MDLSSLNLDEQALRNLQIALGQMESPELATQKAAARRSNEAPVYNAQVPPADTSDHFTIIHEGTHGPLFKHHAASITNAVCGVVLEPLDDPSAKPIKIEIWSGFNWLPTSHFDGEFPAHARELRTMHELGVIRVLAPGERIPLDKIPDSLLKGYCESMVWSHSLEQLNFAASLCTDAALKAQIVKKATDLAGKIPTVAAPTALVEGAKAPQLPFGRGLEITLGAPPIAG